MALHRYCVGIPCVHGEKREGGERTLWQCVMLYVCRCGLMSDRLPREYSVMAADDAEYLLCLLHATMCDCDYVERTCRDVREVTVPQRQAN